MFQRGVSLQDRETVIHGSSAPPGRSAVQPSLSGSPDSRSRSTARCAQGSNRVTSSDAVSWRAMAKNLYPTPGTRSVCTKPTQSGLSCEKTSSSWSATNKGNAVGPRSDLLRTRITPAPQVAISRAG